MEESVVKSAFEKAKNAVADLPEHLQPKAFELAVAMFVGQGTPGAVASSSSTAIAVPETSGGVVETVDLLKACDRNPDRYVVFLWELETSGEPATAEALRLLFRKYRQDAPKLPNRDLDTLVSRGWVEKEKGTNPLIYTLRAKGRSRLAELTAQLRGA